MINEPALYLLLYGVVPLWLLAGFLDWLCHRRSDIAHTSGYRESILHLVMLFELGAPVVAVMLLDINAAIFAFMLLAFVLHSLTSYIDSKYSSTRRRIGVFEQTVHSYLEVLPLTTILLLATMHWSQFTALFGYGTDADWGIRRREPSLPTSYLTTFFLAVIVFAIGPFVEELLRGLRARQIKSTA